MTISYTLVAGINRPGEVTVTDFDHEVVEKLREIARQRWTYDTRLTKSAYRKGFDAGLVGEGEAHSSPYGQKHSAANWMRGDNDPRPAWSHGFRDGQRVRAICVGEEMNVSWREWKALPADLKAKIDKWATENHEVCFSQVK